MQLGLIMSVALTRFLSLQISIVCRSHSSQTFLTCQLQGFFYCKHIFFLVFVVILYARIMHNTKSPQQCWGTCMIMPSMPIIRAHLNFMITSISACSSSSHPLFCPLAVASQETCLNMTDIVLHTYELS